MELDLIKEKMDKAQSFFDTLKNYYHASKLFYVERKPIYKHFVTVIKHLCKINNIPYNSKILYLPMAFILTTFFSENFEYDLSIIFDNSSLLTVSLQNRKIISFAKS